MLQKFKQFAMRGNVMDLAVAVIVGAAFQRIVSSMVDDILMPVLGVFVGGFDISDLHVTIGEAVISYGAFLQAVFDFLIVAFGIFMIIQAINRAREAFEREKEAEAEEEKAKPKPPPREQVLLEEIRDLLRENRPEA